jgi:ribA/ribD-fused uncharacterized protein
MLNPKMYNFQELDRLPKELQPKSVFTPTRGNITAFFTHHSPLSNHHSATMTIDGTQYSSNEQYYAESKAKAFGDLEKAAAIMKETNPVKIKSLAKDIKNFNQQTWGNICNDIMKKGLWHKFHQNKSLKEFLLNTGSTTLVEASPADTYWGAGCSLWSQNIWKPSSWASKGQNIMGKLLEEVRRELRNL